MKDPLNLNLAVLIVIGSTILGLFYYLGKQSEVKAKNVELQMELLRSCPKTILIGNDTILYNPSCSYDLGSDDYTLNPYFYKYTDQGLKRIEID